VRSQGGTSSHRRRGTCGQLSLVVDRAVPARREPGRVPDGETGVVEALCDICRTPGLFGR